MEEFFPSSTNNPDIIRTITKATGLSYNDTKAMLAQIAKVPTADEISLSDLTTRAQVESNSKKLNQIPGSIHLNRNV